MTERNASLWERYRGQGDLRARAELLDSYMGLVHHSAHEMHRGAPGTPELDDLIGAGSLGLVQAMEGFDPARGLAFSTYAMPRIRGAMLDEIHARDWAPRSVRVRRKLLARARVDLQRSLGAAPSEAQVAERLGVDLPTYWKWVGDIEGRAMVALDHGARGSGEVALHERIADEAGPAPGDELLREEQLRELREAIAALPAKDRMVLALYYEEGLTLREIGELLHVTESRVSQIHGRAVRRLRAALVD